MAIVRFWETNGVVDEIRLFGIDMREVHMEILFRNSDDLHGWDTTRF